MFEWTRQQVAIQNRRKKAMEQHYEIIKAFYEYNFD